MQLRRHIRCVGEHPQLGQVGGAGILKGHQHAQTAGQGKIADQDALGAGIDRRGDSFPLLALVQVLQFNLGRHAVHADIGRADGFALPQGAGEIGGLGGGDGLLGLVAAVGEHAGLHLRAVAGLPGGEQLIRQGSGGNQQHARRQQNQKLLHRSIASIFISRKEPGWQSR